MLDTHEYLALVRRRGEAGLELSRVYRNMRRRELFLLAYSNLYANAHCIIWKDNDSSKS
jgi:hydroxyacyl-ACP dehydratase HTD2-like protein with hotdog domain